jgi:hypothetical protein
MVAQKRSVEYSENCAFSTNGESSEMDKGQLTFGPPMTKR